MKSQFVSGFIILAFFTMGIYYYPYETTEYTPVLLDRADLEQSVILQDVKPMNDPGKIYYKDKHVFISEKYKGIHIIDNTDSLSPQKTGFIRVPGCVDLAIKGNVIYADNAVDLVAIELGAEGSIKGINRVKNIFPEITPPDLSHVPSRYSKKNRPEGTIIVGWERKGRRDGS